MAIYTHNSITYGLTGKFGEQGYFRQHHGKTVLCKVEHPYAGQATAKQKESNNRFRRAQLFAQSVIHDPARKAIYEARARKGRSAYNEAISDAMRAPEIRQVKVENGIISLLALDNFEVTKVYAQVYDNTGMLVEEGLAVKVAGLFNWQYEVKAVFTVRVVVKAFDAAENFAEQELFVEGKSRLLPNSNPAAEGSDTTAAEQGTEAGYLNKTFLQGEESFARIESFPEDGVNGLRDRHVGAGGLVDLENTFGGIIPFGHHIQLELGGLHAVTLTDHVTESTVTAVEGVTGYQQIAEIGAGVVVMLGGIAFGLLALEGFEKLLHFAETVGGVYTQKVVAILKPVRDATAKGVNVLEHRSKLHSHHIPVHNGLQVSVGKHIGQELRIGQINARERKVRQLFSGHLFGMAGTRNGKILLQRQVKRFQQEVVDEHIVAGYQPFDG